MNKMTVRDIDVKNKRVLLRVDFNVPLGGDGHITDDGRIRAAIPTIEYLVEQGARVIIMSHMGRPDGKVIPSMSLKVTADRLAELMRHPVQFVGECVGERVENAVAGLESGDILLLENLRFHPEEEANEPVFAENLARLGEVFVDDAFGTAHRAHASIVGVTRHLPAVAGLLLEKELVSLGHILETPARPFCVLFGGAKITDKVKLLENVMDKVDTILVGGGMAATFLKANNYEVGKSIVDEKLDVAAKLMAKAKKYNIKFLLPRDVIVTGDLTPDARGICVPIEKIPPLGRVVDIGLLTISLFTRELERAKTVFWNGPMGIYEMPQFAEGTKSMADVISRLHSTTIIGGGSTAEIVAELKLADKMSFVSTGGGSSMLFLSGEKLPGVEALLKEKRRGYGLMDQIALMRELSVKTPAKIVMVVLDGLGGLPHPTTGKTELESAAIPNLNALAAKSVCGLSDPVMPGITPGSGPGHLALFGYDPLQYLIGRGVLEALGIDFDLKPGDVAARGNLCTLDANGIIADRRAGRVATGKSRQIAAQLNGMEINGVKVLVEAVKDHRLVAVFRGEGLVDTVSDSDPQRIGLEPQRVIAADKASQRMAEVANSFLDRANELLAGHHPANGLLLRGFSHMPHYPGFRDVYKLDACAIASYPMYRGLAKVVGMTVVKTGSTLAEEIETLKVDYGIYDFFFLHVKATDAAGEDGDFIRKVSALEEFDRYLPEITALNPDVLIITGDHSTPATLGGHSWHAVPVLLSGRYCRHDSVSAFNETTCVSGGLGRIPACHLMPLAMANALKLEKYGA